ncbi:hypothetical protein Esti_000547 [Eimeria stiedai]
MRPPPLLPGGPPNLWVLLLLVHFAATNPVPAAAAAEAAAEAAEEAAKAAAAAAVLPLARSVSVSSVPRPKGLAALLHLDNVLEGNICDYTGKGDVFAKIKKEPVAGAAAAALSLFTSHSNQAPLDKASASASEAASVPRRRLQEAAASTRDETLRGVLRELSDSAEAMTLLLNWDFKCLAAQREQQQQQQQRVETLLRLNEPVSSREVPPSPAAAAAAEGGEQVVFTRGVLLRGPAILQRQQQQRDQQQGHHKQEQQQRQKQQQQQFEDRVFGLEALARLLKHHFDLDAAAAAGQQQQQQEQQEQQGQQGQQEQLVLESPCVSSESRCESVLLQRLQQQQDAFLVSDFLPSVGVDVLTLSKLKATMQEKGLKSVEEVVSLMKESFIGSCVSAVSLDLKGQLTGTVPTKETLLAAAAAGAGAAAAGAAVGEDIGDEKFKLQWHLRSEEGLFNLGADKAWPLMRKKAGGLRERKESDDVQIVVAVLDTGCGPHEELESILWKNPRENNCGNNRDDDENGYSFGFAGLQNFVDKSNEIKDTYGHGTAVAALIAGKFGTRGGRGVSPSGRVMCLRVGDHAGVKLSHLIQAMDYVVQQGAQVSVHPHTLHTSYPASFHFPESAPLLVVGASTYAGGKTTKSNYGKQTVHLFAPGQRLYTATVIKGEPAGNECKDCYAFAEGTSHAAALVAGAAVAIWGELQQQGKVGATLRGEGETLGDAPLAMMHAPQSFRGPSAYSYNLRDNPLKAKNARRLQEETQQQQQEEKEEEEGEDVAEETKMRYSPGDPLAFKIEASELPVFAFSPRVALQRSTEAAPQRIKKALLYSTTQSYRIAGACQVNGVLSLMKALRYSEEVNPPEFESLYPDYPTIFEGRLPPF